MHLLLSSGSHVINEGLAKSLLPPNLAHWKQASLNFVPETVLEKCGLSGDDVIAWLHENYPLFFNHLAAFEWISERISFSDAHLIGGMNWRLGLTPAADRNSDRTGGKTSRSGTAGDHYAAMHVARVVALCPKSSKNSPSLPYGRGFRPLKAPLCKQNECYARDLQMNLRRICSAAPDYCSQARVQAAVVGTLTEMVLDRLPMENRIHPSTVSHEVCVFDKSSQQPGGAKWNRKSKTQNSWKRKGAYRDVLSQEDGLCSEPMCLPDAAAVGDAFEIDEDFNSD